MEIQHLDVDFEVKQILAEDDGFFRFEGLASTFGNTDLVDDIVERGAFVESIAKKLPIILFQHNQQEPIGMPEEIRETDEGLFIRVRMPKEDSLVSGRVIPQIKVGSLRTMSIGFRVLEDAKDADNPRIRRIKKVDLIEVSLVTFPANPLARVSGFKSLLKDVDIPDEDKAKLLESLERLTKPKTFFDVNAAKSIGTQRDFEKALRESGAFSKEAATVLAKHFVRGEPADKNVELNSVLASVKSKMDEHAKVMAVNQLRRKVTPHVRRNFRNPEGHK